MRLGIDLGGTKIEAVLLSDSGQILARERTPTPDGYDLLLPAMAELVDRVEAAAKAPIARVGVGMPGSLSPKTGLARNANSTWINGRDILGDLKRALGREVRLANDANCFALSEAADGAGAGAGVVFGAILGTGCGGGVVVGGKVIEGASGIGGEWGHTPLPWPQAGEWPGPRCWCGRLGCLEKWVSGSGFEDDYTRISGEAREAPEIAARAASGEGAASLAFDNLVDRLARGLAVVIDVIDPDVIVFGGGLSNLEALYPAVQARLGRYVFSDVVANKVVKNKHGDSSGVRGAAWLWGREA